MHFVFEPHVPVSYVHILAHSALNNIILAKFIEFVINKNNDFISYNINGNGNILLYNNTM